MSEPIDPPIASTAFSFELVERIQELNGATLPELVDRFNKPKSTAHDHLRMLVELGYLVNEGRTYRVSARFLNLGGQARTRSELFRVVEDGVQQLALDTGEHANLMVEHNGLGIFLVKEKGLDSVRLDAYEGMEVYLHTTALGKAILTEMDERGRNRIIETHELPKATDHTITDRGELLDQLDTVRERGYAIDDEERVEGVRCVATSTTDDTSVAGAVSISALGAG